MAVREPLSSVEPILVTVADEEHRENYLEIRYAPDGERLVTAIELLSPSNKTPGDEGRDPPPPALRPHESEYVARRLETSPPPEGDHGTTNGTASAAGE